MKLRTVITTVTTAAVLSTAGVAIAGAASSPAPASAPTAVTSTGAKAAKPAVADRRGKHHRHGRHHRRLRALVRKVVTDSIGIDRKTLRREIRSGKTIGEIATAHNVAPSAVVAALVTAATAKLDAAASAGKITTDRAHKIEARLPDRFTKLVESWHPRRLRNAAAEARR